MDNLGLALKVEATIDAHPWLFTMEEWAVPHECGTAACLSGHAMLASGYTVTWAEEGGVTCAVFTRPDGSSVACEADEGRSLLGLSDEEYYCADAGEDEEKELFWMDDEPARKRFRAIVAAEVARREAGRDG